MIDIELTDEYWDCNCEQNYIHLRSRKSCPICKAESKCQPDSRVPEVIEYNFVTFEEDTTETKARRLALEWMKSNLDVDLWLEDEWLSLSDEFNLNIYIDELDCKRVTIFSVTDGIIDLENPIEIL